MDRKKRQPTLDNHFVSDVSDHVSQENHNQRAMENMTLLFFVTFFAYFSLDQEFKLHFSIVCVCVRCVCNRRNHYIWNSVHVETSLTWETGHRAANYLFYLLFFIVFASSSSIFGTCAEWRINVVCLKPIKLRWIIRRMYAIRGILYFRWKNSYEHLTKWDKCTRSKQKPNVYLCISVFLFIFVAIHEIPSLMTHLYTRSPSFIKGNFQINFSRCPTHD